MQHKNLKTTYIKSLENGYSLIPVHLKSCTDLNLLRKLQQNNKILSDQVKLIIIHRYLPRIISQCKRIFGINHFNAIEDNLQSGVKGILVAIEKFNFSKVNQNNNAGIFTAHVCVYISKYLNRKKTKYDPLIKTSQGAEFKKVFYKYFQGIKEIGSRSTFTAEEYKDKLLNHFRSDENTLREVEYVHSSEGKLFYLDLEGNIENEKNLHNQKKKDSAAEDKLNPETKYEIDQNQNKNINSYKEILTSKEWALLSLLNKGYKKEKIISDLSISDKRFYFIANNLKLKIKKNSSVETNSMRSI